MNKKGKVALIVSICLVAMLALGPVLMGDARSAPSATSNKLIVAVPTEPDTLDVSSSKLGGVSEPIANNIIETLVIVDPSGKTIPGVASSWKISADGRTIDFTIRKGVKFHSGDPLTVKDVEFSYARAVKSALRMMRLIESFKIIDDSHFRVSFKRPDAQFLPGRGPVIVSKTYYDRVGEDAFFKNPVGTGPYTFVTWAPGEYIDLKANEEYWGKVPSVKQVRFQFVKEDATRVAMLRAGEADMITECPFRLVKEFETAGFKVVKVPTHPPTQVQFHTYNPQTPWFDKRVRMACALAVDGDAIVNGLLHGIPGRYAGLAPWEIGYDRTLKPYPYDPKKAKELLAEAGYPKGFDMPLYYLIGRISGQKETAEAVALYLNAIGIRCKVEGIEAIRFMEKIREWHKSPQAVFASVSTVALSHFHEPTQALEMAYYSESPISLYRNKEFDGVLEKARATLDDSKRGELVKQAIRIIHDDVATIPIWSNLTVFVMKKHIDFTPTLRVAHPMMLIKDVTVRK
jgi:peptide/nickel transport system substrate-binding protein